MLLISLLFGGSVLFTNISSFLPPESAVTQLVAQPFTVPNAQLFAQPIAQPISRTFEQPVAVPISTKQVVVTTRHEEKTPPKAESEPRKERPALLASRGGFPERPSRHITHPRPRKHQESNEIVMTASAYTAAPEENGWGPVDYFGSPLRVGTVAVDPNVIPLGTKLYITGYDSPNLPKQGMIAYARDAGSAIHGKRIDIFLPCSADQAEDFGFQKVKVQILK